VTDGVEEVADPEDWPYLPLNPRPITIRPHVGWWVWLITEKVRHSSFHQVAAVEDVDDDGQIVTVVESRCGLVWPMEYLAAAVPYYHIALDWEADGHHAACRNCSADVVGRRRKWSYWARRLAAQRAGS
jgi:hypothetical protein